MDSVVIHHLLRTLLGLGLMFGGLVLVWNQPAPSEVARRRGLDPLDMPLSTIFTPRSILGLLLMFAGVLISIILPLHGALLTIILPLH